jgi:DNA-directed RNA polymerase specialized sigma24 family protein
MPLGSVKTTMHKAFRQLESILGDQGWDQSDE